MPAPRVHLGPRRDPFLAEGIERGGGVLAPLDEADAVVWAEGPDTFPERLPDAVRWVQLPYAGIEPWLAAGIVDDARAWTSAAGAYSANVAEHAVLLLLAGVRNLGAFTREESWRKADLSHTVGTLRGATVAIIGCGAIGRAMIPLLTALGARVLAVTRSGRPVDGAAESLPSTHAAQAWGRADHVVLAAPATAETARLADAAALGRMKPGAWLVNVARGSLVDTNALVEVLRTGAIGGAALDVTDPEPLPDGHPLWTLPNAIVTPHVANPETGLTRLLADHVAANVARFAAGEPLLAVVDRKRGY